MRPSTTEYDIPYAVVDETTLALDLYRPQSDTDVPVVVYLHGGGWKAGDKRDNSEDRSAAVARTGIAVASVNYRLAPEATYPAPVHDVKAAVRWLRAHGSHYGLAAQNIGLWGASAGGCLAAMVALSADDPDLDGHVGDHPQERSSVQAVATWFAPTDLIANSRRSWLEQLILEPPVEDSLFGHGPIAANDERVRAASPVHRVHPHAPPFLIAHGDRDRIVPESQGRYLHDALTRAGVPSTFCVLGNAGHEGHEFDTRANIELTAAWLKAHLS
ncbi:alpha/beta hydrolase fold domain-containing protein [Nocardia rhizosphaerae]|uniref:Alpha/beta hydrolase fold domain-containing protein n=1 Tax=Nocardia rhizosphaerae TaxID=1691571 RepID=A0ABV8LAV3_9NOCA